jgi:AcrR family transcriptional regulator
MRMNVQSRKSTPATPARKRGRPRTGGRKEDVLEAALTLFSERGFHGTSMPEIANEAELATGTIYRHFASKEQLVNVLYQRCKKSLAKALEVVPDRGELEARFHVFWWALVAFAREHPRELAFLELHHHGSYLDEESRRVEREIVVPLLLMLEPRKRIPLAVTVWGAFVSMIKHARLGYYPLSDEICKQVETTCWALLK